ncbi:MAG TPA: oligosaccharide flippase family protein [Gammaproteobacteria bacterium]|jgi:O-antigen/teichoic acid export membrane protein
MGLSSPSSWLHRALRYRPGRLAWGTLSIGGGLLLQGVLQAAILVVLTRSMGVTEYGGFLAAVALVSLLAPAAGMGCGFLLVRDTARDHSRFPDAFGRGLTMLAITTLPLVAVALLAAHLILPPQVPTKVVLLLGFSELVFAPACELAARAYQGFERSGRLTVFRTTLYAVRFVVLIALVVWTRVDMSSAALGYLGSAAAVAVVTLAITLHELGAPRFHSKGIFAGLADGFHFSVNYAAYRINSDVDKVMLSRLVGLETAGFVGAAFRLMQGLLLPVRALLEAGYARLFHAGARGAAASVSLSSKWLPIPLIFSALAGLGIYFGAGLAPLLFGPDFGGSAQVLRWFAPFPLVSTLHYWLDTLLTTCNRQRYVASVMLMGAGVNILLNLWWIPVYGWHGAVWAAYCSEAMIIALYLAALRRAMRVA